MVTESVSFLHKYKKPRICHVAVIILTGGSQGESLEVVSRDHVRMG